MVHAPPHWLPAALLAFLMTGIAGAGMAQPALPDAAGRTDITHPGELVMARKLAMQTMGRHVETLTFMIQPGAEFHADIAQQSTETIADMLLITPHLFGPETNTMPPTDDPTNFTATNARPEVWSNFADFYQRTVDAEALAVSAMQAAGTPEFTAAVEALQQACDSCHRDYRRTRSTYAIPIPAF